MPDPVKPDPPKLKIVDGIVIDPRVKVTLCPLLLRGPLKIIHGLIIHETGGSNAAGTLAEYRNPVGRRMGAHFLLDKDGTMYQTVPVSIKCIHVGPLRQRCLADMKCKDASLSPSAGSMVEWKKPYPDRYPGNADAIGIEVVGKAYGSDKNHLLYEDPTPQQNDYMHWFVSDLLQTLHLTAHDVYKHPLVSRKQDNEAIGVTW